MNATSSDNGKTVGIIAYLWLVGWVIALILHNNNKTEFGAFHLRQALGLLILWFAVNFITFFLGILDIGFLGWLLNIGLFVLWLIAFIGAIQGEEKLVPAIGQQFQDWFKGLA